MADKFNIGVTGDTGFDIYTEYVEGYSSADGRVAMQGAAYDLDVPAGASLTTIALSTLINDPNVCLFAPQDGLSIFNGSKDLYTTLNNYLVELKQFDSATRVARFQPIVDRQKIDGSKAFQELFKKPEGTTDLDLLVIHDGAGSWRRYSQPIGNGKKNAENNASIEAVSLIEKVFNKKQTRDFPRIIVNLSHDLPSVETNKKGELIFEKNLTIWEILRANQSNVCVVVSANVLRKEGCLLSRRLSWEQTIEDLAVELQLFDKLRILAEFKHLVIRFGVTGALYLTTKGGSRHGTLVFAPTSKQDFYRDPKQQGMILYQNVFLIACLVDAFRKSRKAVGEWEFVRALQNGVRKTMQAFDIGYQLNWTEIISKESKSKRTHIDIQDGFSLLQSQYKLLALSDADSRKPFRDGKFVGIAEIPSDVLDFLPTKIGARREPWEILKTSIQREGTQRSDIQEDKIDRSRLNVGLGIVLFGHKQILNRDFDIENLDKRIVSILRKSFSTNDKEDFSDLVTLKEVDQPTNCTPSADFGKVPTSLSPIVAPILNIGQLTIVERSEIESLRSIRNLFSAYLEKSRRSHVKSTPISIAVFGPPGAGKSFVVKQLAEDVNRSLNEPSKGLVPIEYNVSQFRSIDDIGDAIVRASVVNNEGKIPLVFFDEFDCSLADQELGWLKYFLAPMQDGSFLTARQTIQIARAIFVFAGGVFEKFEQFDATANARTFSAVNNGSNGNAKDLRDVKGPDFVSRLRGHIDIKPLNAEPSELKPIIRRAIVLRGLLERFGFVSKRDGLEIATIDQDIAFALLTIDRFRHGTRSMEAILQMCTPVDGRIEKASLPSKRQLNMHVNANNFFVRMFRGRALLKDLRPIANPDEKRNAMVPKGLVIRKRKRTQASAKKKAE